MHISDHAADLTRYRDWRPTTHDRAGLALDDRQDWIVCPVMITRDTASALGISNWRSQLKILGGESETIEVHRFGHWGPGWFEIVLAHPSRANEVAEIVCSLESYPILDEEDWSREEADQESEAWDTWGGWNDTLRHAEHTGVISERAADLLREYPGDAMGAALDLAREHGYVVHDDSGCSFRYGRIVDHIERDTWAKWLREAHSLRIAADPKR